MLIVILGFFSIQVLLIWWLPQTFFAFFNMFSLRFLKNEEDLSKKKPHGKKSLNQASLDSKTLKWYIACYSIVLHAQKLHRTFRSNPEWLASHWSWTEWELKKFLVDLDWILDFRYWWIYSIDSILAHSSAKSFWQIMQRPTSEKVFWLRDWEGLRHCEEEKFCLIRIFIAKLF